MPEKRKTVVRKKTTTKKTTKRKNTKQEVEQKIQISAKGRQEKEFINIYEKDPVVETKTKLSWVIVGILMIAIISFWFWLINSNINNSNTETDNLNDATSQIDKSMDEFKEMVSDTKDMITHANQELEKQREIDEIKNTVLAQIQVNLESENWPKHSSELIDISFKYPENWYKQEDKDSITITSYDLNNTTTPPTVFTSISITKITDSTEIEAIENLNNLETANYSYQPTAEEIFIDLIPAEKYIDQENINPKAIEYIIIVPSGNDVYKINIFADNGTNLFEPIIEKILSTINLL